MKYSPVKTNFKYPKITSKHYRFGSNKFDDVIILPTGDWRPYLPPEEEQNRNGIESAACYIEAQEHAVATIQEEQYKLKDQNYSARFNALLSNGEEGGGDPLAGAESIRTDGLIPDTMLPFSDLIQTWQDFHSFKGGDEKVCIKTGQEFLKNWKLNYDIVFERDENIEIKYSKLREALRRGPVPMSVLGWYQDDQGNYIKPEGTVDNHFVLCVYLDENFCPYVWDTYSPFLKKLAPFYNSDFCMRWGVTKLYPKPEEKCTTSLGDAFINFFNKIFK